MANLKTEFSAKWLNLINLQQIYRGQDDNILSMDKSFSQLPKKFDSNFLKSILSSSYIILGDVKKESIQSFALFALWILIFDDTIDQKNIIKKSEKEFKNVLDYYLKIINDSNYENKNFASFNKKFENFDLLKKILKNISNEISTKKNKDYFIYSMELFFNKTFEEFILRKENKKISARKYLNLRSIAGGTDVSCELAFLLLNLNLSFKIREDSIFKKIKNKAYKALIIANDILSFNKEKINNEFANNYLTIINNEKKQNEAEIQLMALKKYNQYIIELQQLKTLLLANPYFSSLAEKNEIEQAIQIIFCHVQIHLNWALKSSRYLVRP